MALIAHPQLEPAEFVALQVDAGWSLPLELIGGEGVVTPPSGGPASSAQGELFYALRSWQDQVGDGGMLLQDVFVAFGEGEYPAPDIAWWPSERRPDLAKGAVRVVPELVVEVLSPKTRDNDLGIKRELYMAAGVRELWLVDPDDRSITIVSSDSERTFAGEETADSAVLPSFSVSPSVVFKP